MPAPDKIAYASRKRSRPFYVTLSRNITFALSALSALPALSALSGHGFGIKDGFTNRKYLEKMADYIIQRSLNNIDIEKLKTSSLTVQEAWPAV